MKQLEYKKQLAVEDFAKMTPAEVRAKVIEDFKIPQAVADEFQILAAYMSVGAYGCDSSAWLLLCRRDSGELFEVHGSHCSCFGFEDQFTPEPTTLEYLKSEKFSFSCGGYDDHTVDNRAAVVQFLKTL